MHMRNHNSILQESYSLISELSKLKLVFRNTVTHSERQESTAEHSWSASMIVMILMAQLKEEFAAIDELRAIKLALIHDIVEIYAGDVFAFDVDARKNKEQVEIDALHDIIGLCPTFGEQLKHLWYEFEHRETLEAQIAKAADAMCPIFQRLHAKQSYIPFHITLVNLEQTKYPYFKFSRVFSALYTQLKRDLLDEGLIRES